MTDLAYDSYNKKLQRCIVPREHSESNPYAVIISFDASILLVRILRFKATTALKT